MALHHPSKHSTKPHKTPNRTEHLSIMNNWYSDLSLRHIIQLASKQETNIYNPSFLFLSLNHQPTDKPTTTTPDPKSDPYHAKITQPPSPRPQSEEFMQIIQKLNWKNRKHPEHPTLSTPIEMIEGKFRAHHIIALLLPCCLPSQPYPYQTKWKNIKRERKAKR